MYIKTGLLCLALLMPFSSLAAKGTFDFKFADAEQTLPPTCIQKVKHVKDENGAQYLDIIFTAECKDLLKKVSLRNIGNRVVVSYNGNALSEFSIFSYVSKNVRLSAEEIPRVILMQILDDYEAVEQK